MEQLNEWLVKILGVVFGLALSIIGWIMNRQFKRIDALEKSITEVTREDIDDLKDGHRTLQKDLAEFNKSDTASHNRIYDQINELRKESRDDFKDLSALIKNGGHD